MSAIASRPASGNEKPEGQDAAAEAEGSRRSFIAARHGSGRRRESAPALLREAGKVPRSGGWGAESSYESMQVCGDGRAIRLEPKQRATPHPSPSATPSPLRGEGARHDDQVDSTAQALAWARRPGPAGPEFWAEFITRQMGARGDQRAPFSR